MRVIGLCAAVVTIACSAPEPDAVRGDGGVPLDTAPPPPDPVVLVDSGQALATDGVDGWSEIDAKRVDLDADGTGERVVVIARVELIRGRPAWDDGHPWQVVVERADGQRDLVYARYVQLGTLTMRVSAGSATDSRQIVLLEQMPDRLSVYEIQWTAREGAVGRTAFEQALDATGDTTSH